MGSDINNFNTDIAIRISFIPFVNVKLNNEFIQISTCLKFFDLLIKINTGFFLKDSFIKSRCMIIRRNIKSDFVYDVLGIISIISFYSTSDKIGKFSLLVAFK